MYLIGIRAIVYSMALENLNTRTETEDFVQEIKRLAVAVDLINKKQDKTDKSWRLCRRGRRSCWYWDQNQRGIIKDRLKIEAKNEEKRLLNGFVVRKMKFDMCIVMKGVMKNQIGRQEDWNYHISMGKMWMIGF